jgi:hypothetical protein
MARSFQNTNANACAPSSANTSFNNNSVFSSQQTRATTANTSFTTDGAGDEHTSWHARKNSTSIESLGETEAAAVLTEAEREMFELAKQRESHRIFSQGTSRESNSTYGSIDEDVFRLATDETEARSSSRFRPKASGNTGCPAVIPLAPQLVNGEELKISKDSTLREQHDIRDIPQQNLFVGESYVTYPEIPYFVRFICHQLATAHSFSEIALLEAIHRSANHVHAESFWASVEEHIDVNKHRSGKTGTRLWQAEKRDFEGYTFKGQISLNPKLAGPVFCMQLSPISADKSCRFQRKFGADRFLYLTVPKFDSKLSERHNATAMDQIRKRWWDWVGKEHTFLGRTWKVFHVEPVKHNKTKSRQHDITHDKRIVLFATSGCGIQKPLSIGAMLNWFLPFQRNDDQTFLKAYARFDLGLSRTVPTLVFKPSQVRYIRDILSNREEEFTDFDDQTLKWRNVLDEHVMNDGCSLISVAAAKIVWKLYRGAMGMRGAQALPSAFQGRIGGAKGMWIVSGESFSKDPKDLQIWIEINDSQLKFNPHEEDLLDATFDPLRLSFEVTNYCTPPCASELHVSFIPILEDRGVHRDTIANLMFTRLDAERFELLDSLVDSTRMYEWLHRNGARTSFGVDMSWQAALPVALEEKVKLMLESGFLPVKSAYLASAIERFVQNKQVTKETKLRTPLGKSTFLFGIADPLGVLRPGEIHVQFSSRFTDEVTEESFLHLKNMNVLVARQPACRRSDIQKVRTIVHPDLLHLIDVVVFPSRGRFPLAGKLQGGDYDGDLFWLCWEPALVDPFRNAQAPVHSPEPASLGVKTDKRKVHELMDPSDLTTVDDLIQEAFRFRSEPSLLGLVTVLGEKKGYRDNKVWSEDLDKLYDLHDLLVDAPKQGYTFTQSDFNNFQRDTLRLHKPLKQPAHKAAMEDCLGTINVEEVEKLRQKDYRHRANRILDYLYFDVFRAHNTETVKRVRETFSNIDELDEALLYPYKHLGQKRSSVIDAEICKLKDQLGALFFQWGAGFRKATTTEMKNAHPEDCYQAYLAIQPTNASAAEIHPWLEPYCDPNHLSWCFIKASTLYAKYPYPGKADFVFKMAGKELTKLKAGSFPRSRMIIAPIYANMKPKRIKAPAELDEEEATESEDEFESASEVLGG